MKKTAGGGITVFLALTVTITFALLLTVLESARTQAGRLYLSVAANASIDSLFSQYHRKLWEEYRLLGLEHYSTEQIRDEMCSFMEPYVKARNWYPMTEPDMEILSYHLLTDENGRYFEKEILDYMKYGIAAAVWDLAETEGFVNTVKEGAAADKISEIYSAASIDAVRLEQRLSEISQCLEEQERKYEAAGEELESFNGSGFMDETELMIAALERLSPLICAYEEEADSLREQLETVKIRMEESVEGGELSPETAGILNEDIREFESYIREDGSRRTEIRGFEDRASENIRFLEEMIREAGETEEYLKECEPEEESTGEEELWEPLIRRFRRYDLISTGSPSGFRDTETEQKLENVRTLLKGSLLKLVLPEGTAVSAERMDLADCPSALVTEEETGNTLPGTDDLYKGEYMLLMTDHFASGNYEKGIHRTGSRHLETEYILEGQDNDLDNLNAVITRIAGIRTGLNLIYLYRSRERKAEAEMLAKAIAGTAGIAPLIPVVMFLVLSVWALGQAVCDIRDLLAGHKVPLVHDDKSFYVSLEGLLKTGDGLPQPGAAGEKGWKYDDYLRLFLIGGQGSGEDYRCMDMIQLALRGYQNDFRIDRLICSLEADVKVGTAHVFAGNRDGIGQIRSKYEMHAVTAYSY